MADAPEKPHDAKPATSLADEVAGALDLGAKLIRRERTVKGIFSQILDEVFGPDQPTSAASQPETAAKSPDLKLVPTEGDKKAGHR